MQTPELDSLLTLDAGSTAYYPGDARKWSQCSVPWFSHLEGGVNANATLYDYFKDQVSDCVNSTQNYGWPTVSTALSDMFPALIRNVSGFLQHLSHTDARLCQISKPYPTHTTRQAKSKPWTGYCASMGDTGWWAFIRLHFGSLRAYVYQLIQVSSSPIPFSLSYTHILSLSQDLFTYFKGRGTGTE